MPSTCALERGAKRRIPLNYCTLSGTRLAWHARCKACRMIKSVSLALIALSLAGVACSAADPITNKFDCQGVCQRYSDCLDPDYDVGKCRDRCESDASNSDQKQEKLDDCHDCIGDQDKCVNDILQCTASCGAFVP